jgi:hypothetical protein
MNFKMQNLGYNKRQMHEPSALHNYAVISRFFKRFLSTSIYAYLMVDLFNGIMLILVLIAFLFFLFEKHGQYQYKRLIQH